ncbi:hypothetical protein OEZ71_19425 [Defluviimonas sp. WL0050]|uniref:Uncharacterized protein n=1 Tax=Albidovulum litorale TaxID=2984134 RepID=A0ABT2ZTK0_9RHOB|nr:hypothetical protein [Defluviimonas sp. WL0050]MCV2874476.1 hypothetical protein [Defluviimonas sp. WL0050]
MRFMGFAVSALLCTPIAAFGDDYDLDALRAATEKYQDVNVALAEGFIPDPSGHCISAAHEGLPAEWGAMGIHYLRPDLLQIAQGGDRVDGGSTHTDFTAPAILLYEPQADGSMELVGIENLVFEKAWTDAGNAEPPMFNGRKWDHMSDDPATAGDEAHGFMPHFDQHVWIFRDNPNGVDVPFNPAVTCDHHSG